jgi:ATPase
MIPNAVIAELENLANKGREAGFIGLEEVANLHKLKKKHSLTISFVGQRPDIKHIKYAKSGEIDALIRGLAFKNRATLITADLVQAKSAQAYGLEVLFLKPKFVRKKKSWLSFFKK